MGYGETLAGKVRLLRFSGFKPAEGAQPSRAHPAEYTEYSLSGRNAGSKDTDKICISHFTLIISPCYSCQSF